MYCEHCFNACVGEMSTRLHFILFRLHNPHTNTSLKGTTGGNNVSKYWILLLIESTGSVAILKRVTRWCTYPTRRFVFQHCIKTTNAWFEHFSRHICVIVYTIVPLYCIVFCELSWTMLRMRIMCGNIQPPFCHHVYPSLFVSLFFSFSLFLCFYFSIHCPFPWVCNPCALSIVA